MSDIDYTALQTLGSTPITENSPAGDNIRYESSFEQLEAELSKLESLSNESVDWNVVVQLATEILRSQSKDLLVAAYLVQGLIQTDGYAGLRQGLGIIHALLENFWDQMYPPAKRLRARAAALQWLVEKAGAFAEEHAPAGDDEQNALDAATLLREIDALLVDKMADKAPSLLDLSRPLKAHRQAIEHNRQQQQQSPPARQDPTPGPTSGEPVAKTVTPEPVRADSAPSSPPSSTGKNRTEPLVLESDADARRFSRQLQEMARKLGAYWHKANPCNPRSYRLNRMAAWMLVEQPPPSSDGLTQVNPPPAERRKKAQAQLQQGQYAVLLTELEQSLARMPFWLDGHRMAAEALQALGKDYVQARETVIAETRHFLSRLPTIPQLKFSDGSPFADEQTRLWLDSEVLIQQDGDKLAPVSPGGDDEPAPWQETLEQARKLAARGEREGAMELFHRGMQKAGDQRTRFQWHCSLAEFLIQTGEAEVALSLLEEHLARHAQCELAQWEPGLLAHARQLRYRACKKLGDNHGSESTWREKTNQAYLDLCRIDPLLALSVRGD